MNCESHFCYYLDILYENNDNRCFIFFDAELLYTRNEWGTNKEKVKRHKVNRQRI